MLMQTMYNISGVTAQNVLKRVEFNLDAVYLSLIHMAPLCT